ncbi:MAG: FecR domain-containing protein [Verrucomicrobiota bacterium]|jgi:hypothetical protein|nr:FecR domain-containing protein [Verrucomicrobiota bacterium]MDP7050942.1 FecR domain-containing protein [Verrucomicrobiota bacterium]
MALNEKQQARLLQHLNGNLSPSEAAGVEQHLKEDAEARAFLREVAEQAVVVADVERLAQHREPGKVARPILNPTKWAAAAAIALILVGSFLFAFQSADRGLTAEVVATHGPNQHLAADGVTLPALMPGRMLKVGDKLRTLSSRSWVKLKLNDGSHVILTGRSSMRLIHDENHRAFLLRYGNLWAMINTPEGVRPVSVLTETARLKTANAQFDVETKFQEISVINVNSGSVSTERLSDGSRVDVVADHQTTISMSQRQALATVRQPEPVNHWNCGMLSCPEAVHGRWLKSNEKHDVRLRAMPLLIDKNKTIYATNFSVRSSGSPPVIIEKGSRFSIRLTSKTTDPLYVGITTKKQKGGFFGKYTKKLEDDLLGQTGETREINISISDFAPLDKSLSPSPVGMELTDIWVVSRMESAELELHHVEFLPREVQP